GAASPMPTWCHMVSVMSAMIRLISGVISRTGAATWRSTGSPYSLTVSRATGLVSSSFSYSPADPSLLLPHRPSPGAARAGARAPGAHPRRARRGGGIDGEPVQPAQGRRALLRERPGAGVFTGASGDLAEPTEGRIAELRAEPQLVLVEQGAVLGLGGADRV